jgi:hypothetical protein
MGRLSLNSPLRGLVACLTVGSTGLCARSSCAADADAAARCPNTADVVAGLAQILEAKPGNAWATEIVIHDQGSSWEIEVRGHRSTYSDPARNCEERARVATVFAALVLEPLDADQTGVSVPAAAKKTPPRPAPPRYAVEFAPLLAVAMGAQDCKSILGWGAQGRGSVSGEYLGLSVGAEAAAFDELEVGPYGASILRAALDLSGRLSWRPGPFGLAAELGPYLGLLRVRGTGLFEDSTSSHVDAGARWALLARLRGPRLGPFLVLQAELGGRRFDLTVDPSGSMGTAPRIWLGLALGGVLDL